MTTISGTLFTLSFFSVRGTDVAVGIIGTGTGGGRLPSTII